MAEWCVLAMKAKNQAVNLCHVEQRFEPLLNNPGYTPVV